MADADRMQQALRAAGVSGSTSWESLKRTYNKVMGNPMLPVHFGQEQSLPPHLQDLLQRSGGSYVNALKSDLGDLDRELLRATYDKDYYREPLMGYKSYDRFVQSHGEQASYAQLQKLSPADRLQYLMNFGQQTRKQRAAAEQLERDMLEMRSRDPLLAELQAARDKARQQTQVASLIYDQVLQKEIADLRRSMDMDDELQPSGPGQQAGGDHQAGTPPTDPSGTAQGHPTGPAGSPVNPSGRHQDALDAVARHQIIWEATRKSNPDLFTRLSAAYDRAMGNVTLPATFGDPKSLPDHLQTLLSQSGGYEAAMRSNVGDLDRELLRATFDRSYYQEPLMGYAPYDRFMAKYGDQASAAQVQKLSPPDRLRYLANHGKQSADDAAALQELVRNTQRAGQMNAQMDALQKLREEVRKQEAINAGIFNQMANQAIRDARQAVNEADDDDF